MQAALNSEFRPTETLRKYPPFPFLSRIAAKDYRVPDTDIVLRKGQMVITPIYAIQHDANIYPDPEEFRPERFTPEEVQKRPACSFMPFAFGPRNCLAMKMGMMQIQGALTTVLRNYELSIERPKGDISFNRKNIVLESREGIHVKCFPL